MDLKRWSLPKTLSKEKQIPKGRTGKENQTNFA